MDDETCLKIWGLYQSAWGPVDDEKRRDLLTRSVADDVRYADHASQTHGVEELAERMAHGQAELPGLSFINDSFLQHHGQALFEWTMYNGKGDVFVKGASYCRFGEDGRIAETTGFFEPPKET